MMNNTAYQGTNSTVKEQHSGLLCLACITIKIKTIRAMEYYNGYGAS